MTAKRFDWRGHRCPLPVIKTEAALRGLAPGDSILVAVDDPLAEIDLPHYCRVAGHDIERIEDFDGAPQFRVTCKRASPDTR